MNTVKPSDSAPINLRPLDRRCKYIGIVADLETLPMPADVQGIRGIPGNRLRGDVEVFGDQYAVDSESVHHRENRGYTTRLYMVADVNGKPTVREITWTNAEVKDAIRNAEVLHNRRALLSGAGDAAHVVRCVWAIKLGLLPRIRPVATVSEVTQ